MSNSISSNMAAAANAAPFMPQPVHYLPYPTSAVPYDYSELKARVEAFEAETKDLRGKISTLHKEANQLKVELTEAKTKLEGLEDAGRSPIVLAEIPRLDGPSSGDFMEWYMRLQPVLKALKPFHPWHQMQYIALRIDQNSNLFRMPDSKSGINQERLQHIKSRVPGLQSSNEEKPFAGVEELVAFVGNQCYGVVVNPT